MWEARLRREFAALPPDWASPRFLALRLHGHLFRGS
jgi:hypothetical protein